MGQYDRYDPAGKHEYGNYYNPSNPEGINRSVYQSNQQQLYDNPYNGIPVDPNSPGLVSANPKTMRWIIVIGAFVFFILPYLIF